MDPLDPQGELAAGASAAARPFVWLAGALGAGTLLGLRAAEGSAATGGLALIGLALAAILLARRGVAPLWAFGCLVLAFARASALDEPALPVQPLSALAARSLRAQPLVGLWRSQRDGRTGRLEPLSSDEAGAGVPGPALVLEPECVAPEEGTPVAILPGSEVVPWPRGPVPGSRARRSAASTPVATDELVRLAPAPRGLFGAALHRLEEALHGLRATLGARAAEVEREQSAGLLRALAIGARDGLAAERVDLFARTGTSHLLAISGWHVSLFAALVVLPLARVTPRARRSLLGIAARALLLVAFAAVAGAEKPVLRATLALLFVQLAALRESRRAPRRPDGLSFLGAAFALECLVDPAGIRSLSLALSYAATLGLIVGTGSFARALRPVREPWSELAGGRLARVGTRGRALLASGLAASAAAVLATLPFTWSTFGELAPIGVVLTPLALVPFGFLSLIAWLAALVPCSALAPPAELGARVLYALLELGDALGGSPLVLPPRPFALLAAATLLVFLAGTRAWARRAAALVWGALLLPWSAAPRGLELFALDVGHGSAVVLRAPGIEALVFDAGSRDRRALASEALLPLLACWDVARACVVLSHPDADHASGLARLAERIPIEAWLGAEPAQGPVRLAHGSARLDLRQGRLEWRAPCRELSLALLRGSAQEGNEGSRVLELAWRGERLLLLGDAEEAGLAGLRLAPGPLRLLLAPHHGSDALELGALLARHPPAEVWISASDDPPIAAELERRGLGWRWTGRDGPLALRLP